MNRSIPIIQSAAVAPSDEHGNTTPEPEPKILACLAPTWADHRLLYVLDFGTHSPSSQVTRNVPAQDILRWVSHDELTRFEHQRCKEEQAFEDAQPPAKKRGRPSKRFGQLRPLDASSGTESISSDEEGSRPLPSLANELNSGQQRPRGRPPKHPAAIQVRVATHVHAKERSPNLSSSTASRKRRRSSVESPEPWNRNADQERYAAATPTALSSTISRRQRADVDLVSLPYVKKRIKKTNPTSDQRSDLLLEHEAGPMSLGQHVRSSSMELATGFDADGEKIIYHPAIAYSDDTDEDDEDDEEPNQNSTAHLTAAKSSRSLSQKGERPKLQGRRDYIKSAHYVLDESSTNATAESSSDEDELAILHDQFQVAARNHLRFTSQLPPTRKPKPKVKPNASYSAKEDERLAISDIPPGGRQRSLSLGNTPEAEVPRKETPARPGQLLARDRITASKLPPDSDDDMLDNPAEQLNISPKREIVEISSDESSVGDYQSDGHQPVDPQDNEILRMPNIPSSQSFVASQSSSSSSSSSDELHDVTPRRVEVVVGHKSVKRTSTEKPTSRAFFQSRASKASEQHAPRARKGASSISTTKRTVSKQTSGSAVPKNQAHKQQLHPSRPRNPLQQFAKSQQQPTGSGSLAAMGAGAAFPAASASRGPSAASAYADPNTQLNPFGCPLPLHPITPPRAPTAQSRSADGKTVESRPSTAKRPKQSLTPLYPRGAIVPGLTPGAPAGSPNKKKQYIFSSMQFQE